MTILIILGVLIVLYLLIAFGVYTWAMWGSDNVLQKSMSGFVVLMALAWPLGLVLFVWDFITGRNKEQRP